MIQHNLSVMTHLGFLTGPSYHSDGISHSTSNFYIIFSLQVGSHHELFI